MVEFKIHLEESVVQKFGYDQVENYLQDSIRRMLLKAAAQDVLEELKYTELENDKEWQTARHLAWQQEKNKYLKAK